jgi:hypothetical protein
MMKSTSTVAVVTALLALLGCQARTDDSYRGESLLRIKGGLVLSSGELSEDAVPALAFEGEDLAELHILEVDTAGEFPAQFTLNVMSPPPEATMRAREGLPSYAIGYITALPEEHPSEIIHPYAGGVDGAGGFTWCEEPNNTDCYRSIEQCEAGTDNCYRELARCEVVPIAGGPEGATTYECDEILEQSGDPRLAFFWTAFLGLSTNHFLLYTDRAGEAGIGREYLERGGFADAQLGLVFGNDPIPAGYHLVQTRFMDEQERFVNESCGAEAEAAEIAIYNQAHGTELVTTADLGFEHPDFDALMHAVALALFDAGCFAQGIVYERVDPSEHSIEVVLGTRDQDPLR